MTKSCCAPSRPTGTRTEQFLPPTGGSYSGPLAEIPAGRAYVGTNRPWIKPDGEGPQRRVSVKAFAMGATPVTVGQFRDFVDQTGYRTEAEDFGWSFVFHSFVPQSVGMTEGMTGAEWWRRVDGATWFQPFGPHGSDAQGDDPVVHVSWNDAQAYCTYVGGRLPSEAEWEHAARGGLGDVVYPWGNDDPTDTGPFQCNIWQGRFPVADTGADGFAGISPAQSFPPNSFGLFGMAGNVWDWTNDSFRVRSLSKAAKAQAAQMNGFKVIKGGSYLCHASYCTRYRIAARTGNSADSSTGHTGFRVVFDR